MSHGCHNNLHIWKTRQLYLYENPKRTKDTKDGCTLDMQHVLDQVVEIPMWLKQSGHKWHT